MTTAKIETFKTVADFEALGKRIRTAASTPYNLVQVGLVAAFQHLDKNGNVNVLKPIVEAIESSFLNAGMIRRVRHFILEYTWLEYNARGLKPAQLRDAQFDTVWTKNKVKAKESSIDIAGATDNKWWEVELPVNDAKPMDIETYAKTFAKRIQKMIDGDKLMKGKALASVGEVRSMLRVALEKLEAKHKVTTTTKVVAKKAGVTAKRLPAGKARGHKAVKPAPVKAPATVEAKAA